MDISWSHKTLALLYARVSDSPTDEAREELRDYLWMHCDQIVGAVEDAESYEDALNTIDHQLAGKSLLALIDEVQESRKFHSPKKPTEVHHIAGYPIRVGPLCRQLCAWCGAVLGEYDLTTIATSDGQPPGAWAEGAIVRVAGIGMSVVEHRDGDDLPDPSCVFPTEPKKPRLSVVK